MPKAKTTVEINIKELEALRRDSERLKQLNEFLPDCIKEGYVKRLELEPYLPQSAFLWRGMSNAELRENVDSPGASVETLRRSFIGVQRFNKQQPPDKCIYPTERVLAEVAGCDTSAAKRYWLEPLSRSELHAYSDALEPRLTQQDERHEHNVLLRAQTGKSFSELIDWPAEFD